MEMKKQIVLGIKVNNRLKHVPQVQSLLSEYGCNIKTRVGLHEVDENFCSTGGLILLELCGEDRLCLELTAKLEKVEEVTVQKMIFDRDR